MSKPNDNTTPLTVAFDESAGVNVKKPSILARTKKFATKHKKPLIAAGLLAGVVTIASKAGKKSCSTETSADLAESPVYDAELNELDNTVA